MTRKLLWTHTSLAAATGGSILKPFNVYGICIDSRNVQDGDLFIALKAKRDGHYYVKNAAQKKASAALVSWKHKSTPNSLPLVFVKNTRIALEALAKAARARCIGRMIAVTGSAGKTTTKSLLSYILSNDHLAHCSQDSFNNHLGVPITLAQMPADTQFGIFEIGMNNAGEITPLSQMVRPHIGVITTVGAGHIGNFASQEGIALAKSEIFSGIIDGGNVILPCDNPYFDLLSQKAEEKNLKIISFGRNENANIRILSHEVKDHQTFIELSVFGENISLQTHLLGDHNISNIAATIGVLRAIDFDFSTLKDILSSFIAPKGRGDKIEVSLKDDKKMTIINESYNANPLSMRAALSNMAVMKSALGDGPKIAILGQMLELGEGSKQYHSDLKEVVLSCGFDRIYLIGKDMEVLYDALGEDAPSIFANDLDDVFDEIVQEEAIDGACFFIKGSNNVGLERIISHLSSQKNEDAKSDI